MNFGVSVICSTNKINSFDNIVSNFMNQNFEQKELIIGLNYDIKSFDYFERIMSSNNNIKIIALGGRRTLGECLNTCIEKAKYPIISKFDDDDYYSPFYLTDMVKLFSNENIDIVGKACYY